MEIGIIRSTAYTPRSLWRSLAFGLVSVAICSFAFALDAPAKATASSCVAGGSGGGGISVVSSNCKPVRKARLVNGKAIAPASAPARVKRVINWANRIRNKPYRWGGGHGSFFDSGYDCSGSISFALRGGRFISSPMASTGYMNWRKRGKGRWISVYSNPSHAYMVVAGLRFDTSMTPGSGPGWSKSLRSTRGRFSVRHPAGF